MNKNAIKSPLSHFRLPKLGAAALGGLLLVGCASNPPDAQFAVTESAVNSATSAESTEYAPVEMRSAREKWDQAERAMQEENYEEARRLAEQAEWDARVAERKARAAKAQKALQDANEGIEELRQEGMRSAE
jgi:hypothetical protein